jgi:hypothetical protein
MGDAAVHATIAAARELMREKAEIMEQILPLQARLAAIDDVIASLAAYQNAIKGTASHEAPQEPSDEPDAQPTTGDKADPDAPNGAYAEAAEPKAGAKPWDLGYGNTGNGVLTQKQAIVQVLKAADGPIHSSVLWDRMKALGIKGGSSNPLNVLDNQILDMRKKHGAPIHNWGRRMYEWRGPKGQGA